jgi:hypothetical protein
MDPSGKLLGTNGILKGVPNRYDWSGELTLSTFSEVCFALLYEYFNLFLLLHAEKSKAVKL